MPDNGTLSGEDDPLLTNEITPVAVPVICGAKVTLNGSCCPAATVAGKEIPLREYPEPLQLALETVTAAPVARKFPVSVWRLPRLTLPKLNAAGTTDSWADFVPDPASATDIVELAASLTIERASLVLPAAKGANVTSTRALCPGASDRGKAGPDSVNALPDTVMLETVIAELEAALFVTDKGRVLLLPSRTLPKFREVLSIERVLGAELPAVVMLRVAAHPITNRIVIAKTMTSAKRGRPTLSFMIPLFSCFERILGSAESRIIRPRTDLLQETESLG